jgi:hypothetical protein
VAHVAKPVLPDKWISEKFSMMCMMHTCPKELLYRKEQYFTGWQGKVAGGFLSAPIDVMINVCQWFQDKLAKVLDEGFAPFEDMILPLLYMDHSDAFRLFYGDYETLFTNYNSLRICDRVLFYNMEHCYNCQQFDYLYDVSHNVFTSWNQSIFTLTPFQIMSMLQYYLIACIVTKHRIEALTCANTIDVQYQQNSEFASLKNLKDILLHMSFITSST